MRTNPLKTVTLLGIGFAAGIAGTNLVSTSAAATTAASDLSTRKFLVSIDEVRQNFVFGDEFSCAYKRTVEMSDGSKRTIELTPMVHDGVQVVEFRDTGSHTYMGLNGTTINGKLMVHVVDVAGMHAQLREQGWKLPGRDDR